MSSNHILVPHPVVKVIVTVVDDGQDLTQEQRSRVVSWLVANGIDPKSVAPGAITLEYLLGDRKGRQLIGFRQYYL